MEDKSTITTDIISAIVPSAVKNDYKPPPPLNDENNNNKKNRNKKKSSFNFIKAALLMMRRRSTSKSKSVVHEAAIPNEMLKKLVGSMRPLHLQDNQSPPPSIPTMPSPAVVENYEDVLPSPMSSADGMSRYASVDNLQELEIKGRESRYASATNLQELDTDDESDDGIDENGGDEMIDSKADEFIAHFYHQMRLQGVKRSMR